MSTTETTQITRTTIIFERCPPLLEDLGLTERDRQHTVVVDSEVQMTYGSMRECINDEEIAVFGEDGLWYADGVEKGFSDVVIVGETVTVD